MGNIKGAAIWLHLLLWGFHLTYGQQYTGRATVDPEIAYAHEPGTWRVVYVPGSDGIRVNGGIKVRMPKGFGQEGINHISYLPFQISDSLSRGYVKATSTRSGVRIDLSFTKTDAAINWDWDRVSLTFTAKPIWTSANTDPVILRATDSLIIEFGANPPYGSAFAPHTAFTDSIFVAADENGNGVYQNIYPRPLIRTLPGAPRRLVCLAQTTQQVGIPFPLNLLVLDEFENLVEDFSGTIQLMLEDAIAGYEMAVDFLPGEGGSKTVEALLQRAGVFRFRAKGENQGTMSWDVMSNPIEAYDSRPDNHIYWGDLHSHSAISHDGHGRENFRYARDVSKLDFFALTDHTTNDYVANGITDKEWAAIKDEVIAYHEPGKFETILGYEISFAAPSGHQNVYMFADNDTYRSMPLFRRHTTAGVPQLWSLLRSSLPAGTTVFTAPHHTGVLWNGISGPVTSLGPGYRDSLLRPVFEIFSSHGSSEKYPPEPGMSYADFDGPSRVSAPGHHYAHNALDLHHHVGFMASSDDHSGRPGIRTRGIAAILAPRLSRDDIYDAVMTRSVYGTTGERILLRFREENIPMGSKGHLQFGSLPRFHISVHGTDEIDHVELLRWDFFSGSRAANDHPVFLPVNHYHVSGTDTTYEYTDSSYTGPAVYYLRVKQKNVILDNSLELPGYHHPWAWSSPIWVGMPEGLSTDEDTYTPPPRQLTLLQNFPNPFGSATEIPFQAASGGRVAIGVYNLLGERVAYLSSEIHAPGYYTFPFQPENLAAGVYMYKLEDSNDAQSYRMTYVK